MTALTLGLIAAVAWGFHDICVRFVSQRTPLLAALLCVLVTGLVFHVAVMLRQEGLALPSGGAARDAALAGAFFLIASLGLYGAFQRGPVRLVAPIIASYPILSVGWAAVQGVEITVLEWLAVLAIVFGVSIVAALADDAEAAPAAQGRTILLAAIAACGFAGTFAFGQAAAEAAGELPATLLTRIVATLALVLVILALRCPLWPDLKALPILILMGLADGIALLCVLAAGRLPDAQYAAVASSIFGLLTIVMAWALLREPMRLPQWLGCAITFAGIGYLAL